MSFEDFNNYIVLFPSGEVLEVNKIESNGLLKSGLIKNSESGEYFISYDYLGSNIKKSIEKNQIEIRRERKINQIKTFLYHVGVLKEQFKINDDLSIDIIGSITMTMMSLSQIPHKFNRCTGNFICSFNNLTTLKNSPDYVGGKFDCSYNRLFDLKGGPKFASTYLCNNNKLNNLDGSPHNVKYFNCSSNNIINYDSVPNLIPGGKIISENNPSKYEKI